MSESNKSEKFDVIVDIDLEELIPGFLKNRQDDLNSFTEYLEKEDYDGIKFLGHKMKGAGGGYGFDRITEIGLALENAANARNSQDIKSLLDALKYYLEHVEITFE